MKMKFTKLGNKLASHHKPFPTVLPYSTTPIVTAPITTKEIYKYITPYIKYYTLEEENTTDLFVKTSTNQIAIRGFTDPIIDIQIFKLKLKVNNIEYGLLTITKNQMIIYGIETIDNEFALVNLDITVYVGDEIRKVVVSEGNIIFCTDSDIYQFYYLSGFFKTSYIYQYKSIKEYIWSFFLKETRYIKDICMSKEYAVVLKEKYAEVYKVTDSLKFYKKIDTGKVESVFFYTDNIFFTVDNNGNRVYYSEKGRIVDVPTPQSFAFYDGKTHINSDGDTLVIVKSKKNEKNSIILVITQNKYFKQSEPNKENYQTYCIYDDVESINVYDKQIIIKSRVNTHKLCITPPGQYFLNCKHIELTNLHKLYGNNDFLLHYLYLIEGGFDVSKLDFMFMKAENYDFIYEYMFRKLIAIDVIKKGCELQKTKEIYSETFMSPCYDDYVVKLCRTINAFKAVYAKLKKYRKDNYKSTIDDFIAVLDTLRFIKIVKERRVDIDFDFETLVFNIEYRKKIFEELSINMPYDKINQIVTETLKNYFPVEEIYFRKGMDNVKKRRRDTLFDSINDFKECSNLEEIIKIYNDNKFYTGSVTIIKEKMFGFEEMEGVKRRRLENNSSDIDLTKVTKYLINSIKCKGALNTALEDYREEFIFCVLEAVLKNILSEEEYNEKCTCCDRDLGKLEFSGPLAVARMDTPHLAKFLELKFEFSNVQDEYNLYWKYYILKNEKDKAKEILMRIIKEKPITLERRIKYLERGVVLFQSNELRTMLRIAEIQRELSNNLPECLELKINYYDQNELFNDWLYGQNPFLALQLMFTCKNNDIKVKTELFSDLLEGDYEEATEKISFYNELNKKGWVEIEIVGDIAIKKLEMVQRTNLVHVLKSFNYDELTIKKFMEKRIKDNVFANPEQKRRILREYKDYFGYSEKTMEFETFCYKNYGVKV